MFYDSLVLAETAAREELSIGFNNPERGLYGEGLIPYGVIFYRHKVSGDWVYQVYPLLLKDRFEEDSTKDIRNTIYDIRLTRVITRKMRKPL